MKISSLLGFRSHRVFHRLFGALNGGVGQQLFNVESQALIVDECRLDGNESPRGRAW